MSKESMIIVRNSSEQLKIKKQQLLNLQTKEVEANERAVKLAKLLEQAELDHQTCMLANLAGNANDQEIIESKIIMKGLIDSLQEAQDDIKLLSETRPKLMSEISALEGDRTVHRSILCAKMANEAHEEMASNRKLKEKLVAGYAPFRASGDFDTSWTRYLLLNYPLPSEHEINLAAEKFRASNDFMRD